MRGLISFTNHAIQTWNQEAKKFRSLKYFEVCNVQEKEPEINGQKFIKPIGAVIYPK
jgi:hypothetical protein